MANQIIGRVFEIGQTTSIPTKSGNTFQKRQIVLDASHYDQYTGQKYENYPQFQFLQMNCAQLDNFKVGDIVVVSFALNGRSYEKDGVKKIMIVCKKSIRQQWLDEIRRFAHWEDDGFLLITLDFALLNQFFFKVYRLAQLMTYRSNHDIQS